MSKQTFKIGKSFIPNILVLSCSAILLLFGTLLAVSPVASHTNALVQTGEDGLSLVTNQTLDATIKPAENGSLYVVKDTIVGSINSQFGYEVYVSVNSSSVNDIYLNGDTTNTGTNQKINATTGTYAVPTALDLTDGATWGYAIAGLGSFDATYDETNPASSAKFAAMPVIENKQLIHESSSAIADDETEIYYGIKADTSLEPGLYTTEILYTAVPKPAPMVAKAILGDNGNLSLIYDNLTYAEGDTYTDNLGETEIVEVFNIPEYGVIESWTNLAYSHMDSVTSINIEDSFHDFEPMTVAYWFNNLKYVTSITNIENLNTSQTQCTDYLFDYLGSEVDTLDMGNVKLLDFRNVISANGMFYGTGYKVIDLVLNLDGLNFANATTMHDLFDNFGYSSKNITLSLKNWNVPKVTNLRMAFWDVGQYSDGGSISIDVSGWTLGSLQDISSAFHCAAYYASSLSLVGLSDWDMSTVTNASYAFESLGRWTTSLELTIENWNLGTNSGLNAEWMFYNVGYNTTGDVILNFSGWTFGPVNTDHMFTYVGGSTQTKFHADFSDWTFTTGSLQSMFHGIGSSYGTGFDFQVDVTDWDLGNVAVLKNLFYDSGYGSSSYAIIGLNTWDVSTVYVMESMFSNAGPKASTWDIGNIGGWNTGSVINMNYMFSSAGYNATTWSLGDISGWDVSHVSTHSGFISLNNTGSNASVVNNQPGGWT